MSFGESNKSAFGSRFRRVKTDAPATVALCGDEVIEWVKFDEARQQTIIVSESHPGAQNRFAVNCYDPAADMMQILEAPIGQGKAIFALGGVDDHDVVELSRTGAGRSTKYFARRVRKLTAEELQKKAAHNLHDLGNVWSDGKTEHAPMSDGPQDQVPF